MQYYFSYDVRHVLYKVNGRVRDATFHLELRILNIKSMNVLLVLVSSSWPYAAHHVCGGNGQERSV